MSSIVRKQDLPPPGGYPALNFARIPTKKFFNSWVAIGATLGCFFVGTFFYRKNLKEITYEQVEERSAIIALEPLLYAERDRAFLKQLRKNRDEENRLMADVEDWVTGYYFKQPLYHTVPKDTLLFVPFYEFYAHVDPEEAFWRRNEFLLH